MSEMKQDVRWKQRYQNLSLAVTNLGNSLQLPDLDIFQRAGMLQFFEMSFELAWETMKDYYSHYGMTPATLRRR